jgi:hypothetical protein
MRELDNSFKLTKHRGFEMKIENLEDIRKNVEEVKPRMKVFLACDETHGKGGRVNYRWQIGFFS